PLCPGRPGGPETDGMAAVKKFRQVLIGKPGQFLIDVDFQLLGKAKRWFSPARMAEYATVVLVITMTAWMLLTTKAWGQLHAALALHVLVAVTAAAVWWDYPHYWAPAACIYYFLAACFLRRLSLACPGALLPRMVRPRHMVLICNLLVIVLPAAIGAAA